MEPTTASFRPREYTCVDLFEGFLQLRVRNLQMRVQNVQNQNPIFSARTQRTSNLALHFPGRDSAGHRDRKSLGRFVQLVDAMEVFSYGSRSLKNVTALCLKAFINCLGVIVLDVVPQLPNAFVPLLNIGLQERGQAKGPFQRFFPSASLFSKRYLQRQKRGKERPNCRPCIPVNQTFTAEPPALTDAIQHTHSLIPCGFAGILPCHGAWRAAMADRLLTAVQTKHTARVFLSEARARRHGLGATGSRSTPLGARVCAPPPRPTAGAAARTGTAGPAGSVRMSALAFPLSLKLPSTAAKPRLLAIARSCRVSPGFPELGHSIAHVRSTRFAASRTT